MSIPSPLSQAVSESHIVDDLKSCIDQLKTEFNGSSRPITDDNKILQRFCAKLEFLLQHHRFDKSSLLGGRKDYWNYFLDALASNKGFNDGLVFVKNLNELKTNLGRGRAFIRFCLMYQRLADCMQLCTSNTKLTSVWYKSESVWRNPALSSYLISSLYDLNDVTFDIGAQGYDLDNGWPVFSRNDLSQSNKWNIMFSRSRSSSISSLNQSSTMPGSPWHSSTMADGDIHESDEMDDNYGTCLSEAENNQSDQLDSKINQYDDSVLQQITLERDTLKSEVKDLQTELKVASTKVQMVDELKSKLRDMERQNAQLVENMQLMVQDKSAKADSLMDHITKMESLMARISELEKESIDKERECETIRSSSIILQGQLCAANIDLEEANKKLEALSQDKTNLESHLSVIANSLMEKSSVIVEMTKNHKTEMSTLQTQLDNSIQEKKELSQQLVVSGESCSILKQEINLLKELSASSSLTEKTEMESILTKFNDLRSSAENYRLNKETELTNLLYERKVLKDESLKYSKEVEVLKESNEQLQKEKTGKDQYLASTKEQLELQKIYCDKLREENHDIASLLLTREHELSKLQSDLKTMDLSLSNLLREMDDLKSNIQVNQIQVTSLEQELHASQTLCNDLNGRVTELNDDNKVLRTNLNNELQRSNKLDSHIQGLNGEVLSLKDERTLLFEKFNLLEKDLNNKTKQVEELSVQLINIHTSHDTNQQRLAEIEQEMQTVNDDNTRLVAEYESIKSVHESMVGEYKTLEQDYERFRQAQLLHLQTQQTESYQMVSENQLLISKNKALLEENESLKALLDDFGQEKRNLEISLKTVEEQRQQLSQNFNQVNEEIETLRSALKSLKSVEVEKSSELSLLQSNLENTKLDLKNKQTAMEEQMRALRFQLSSQQMEADLAMQSYIEQQTELQRLSATISSQERMIATIELQLDNLQDEHQLKDSAHDKEMNELIELLEEKEEQLSSFMEELESLRSEIFKLTETNESLNESLVHHKLNTLEHQARNENELHQLREDNIMLKRRLVRLIKDKESLWQTTDQLIFKQRRFAEVKWIDETNIYNCMGCRSQFSLLLRKHHCRLCGRVFCWQCSNNWVDTVASNKKCRACNQCYIDYNQELPSTVNSSLITSHEDTDSPPLDINTRKWIEENSRMIPSPLSGASPDTSTPDRPEYRKNGTETEKLEEMESKDQLSPLPSSYLNTNNGFHKDGRKIIREEVDNDFEEITDEEIERSLGESYSSATKDTVARLTQMLKERYDVLANSSLALGTGNARDTVTLNRDQVYSVCCRIDACNTDIRWSFTTSQAVYFELAFEMETSDTDVHEILIAKCRCNSHKQQISGEMIGHRIGLYVFRFSNTKADKVTLSYEIKFAESTDNS